MKDYRYIGRYKPEEWEDDIDWLARRMDFIWDYRQFYTQDYLNNGMCEELQQDFYGINNSEVSRIAAKLNKYEDSFYKTWELMSDEKLADKYNELISIKKRDRNEFMKKNNCYLYCYIIEQRWNDVSQYIDHEE